MASDSEAPPPSLAVTIALRRGSGGWTAQDRGFGLEASGLTMEAALAACLVSVRAHLGQRWLDGTLDAELARTHQVASDGPRSGQASARPAQGELLCVRRIPLPTDP